MTPARSTTRFLGAILATAVVAGLGVGCSSDNATDKSSDGKATTTVDAAALAKEPRYAKPGPYAVGVTTLKLADGRAVEVYYPADKAAAKTKPLDTYLQTDAIPADMLAGLPKPPAGTKLTVEVPAHRDVTSSEPGKFPIVLFSHGAGGWRDVYGTQLAGVASWGFVVASIDFSEYGLLASFGAGGPKDATKPTPAAVAMSAADLVIAEAAKPKSVLSGAVDPAKIAGMGHSAGGGTMFGLLDEPRVSAIVGWAPVGPKGPVTSKTPTLIMAGGNDIAITPTAVKATYGELKAPKRLVIIDNMGHNGFGDSCLAIRSGTDLIGIAKGLGIPIPDRLLQLGRNGCEAKDLDTRKGWDVTQHFTVAQLRSVFGIDPQPVGLGDGIEKAFGGVTMTYEHQDK